MSDYPDLPKVGDIVYWENTYTGYGHLDGKVVSIEGSGVYVSMYKANGVHYALVPLVRIVDVKTPERDREDGSVEANKSFERFIFGRMSQHFKKKTP